MTRRQDGRQGLESSGDHAGPRKQPDPHTRCLPYSRSLYPCAQSAIDALVWENPVALQELMREQMSEDILVKRAAHRRMHTLLQLNIQETGQPPTCLRLMGLTGVPGVCLKSAMQLAHSISGES